MIQRTISILGSTGSIGTQTLDVAEACGIRVAALTANHNIDLLEQQARIFKPVLVAAADMTAAAALAERLSDTDIRVMGGQDGILVVDQCLSHGLQGSVLLLGGQGSDGEFCRLCGFEHIFHRFTSPKSVPMGFPSKIS